MDTRLEEALAFANYQKTLSVKRKELKERIDAKLTFAQNGGIFKIDQSLITFVDMLVNKGRTENIPLIDQNGNPILIYDLTLFLEEILNRYFSAGLEYYQEFEQIKKSRSVEKLLEL